MLRRPGTVRLPQFRQRAEFVSALAILFSFTVLLRGQALPKAPGAEVFTLTPAPGFFTEPAVAVDPNDAQHVLAVFQDNVHASYSQDAGRTWHAAEGVAPANYRVSGDVSTAFDAKGHAFVCYIAFDKLGSFNYWAHGASRNGVFVRRSLDGGKTWEVEHSAVSELPTAPGIPFEDKPSIVSDTSQSRYSGNLYVGWTRWTLTDSEIVLSRSSDDGKTWSKPVEIDRHPGLPRDDNGAAEGFAGVVGPDGTLYAVWSQDNEIVFTTSRDGGQKFSRARGILHTAPIMFAVETLERANGFPQIAMDARSGQLYVTWSDYRNGDLDVFISSSSDGGKKWSAPTRVNNDAVHNGAEQFFQWLAVDPVDGAVNVIFYDRRQSAQNRDPRSKDPQNKDAQSKAQIVVLASSTDGARSFQNYAWTSEPFEAGGVFFGDYSGIAASSGRVYGVWTEKPAAAAQKAGDAEKKPENKNGDEKPKPPGTVVKVGIADFNVAAKSSER